jgi:hypothetical protein
VQHIFIVIYLWNKFIFHKLKRWNRFVHFLFSKYHVFCPFFRAHNTIQTKKLTQIKAIHKKDSFLHSSVHDWLNHVPQSSMGTQTKSHKQNIHKKECFHSVNQQTNFWQTPNYVGERVRRLTENTYPLSSIRVSVCVSNMTTWSFKCWWSPASNPIWQAFSELCCWSLSFASCNAE